jgi:hypothetical protein
MLLGGGPKQAFLIILIILEQEIGFQNNIIGPFWDGVKDSLSSVRW